MIEQRGVVGFIGLGTMGREMVRNLIEAGHRVRAHDIVPAAMAAAVANGAEAAASVGEAAEGADIVITMLPDTPDVLAVVSGPGGLLDNLPAGRLIADMSTISPQAVRHMHAEARKRGIGFIDAPVSGGPGGARDGTLAIMAGGDEADFLRARPYFEAMGATITWLGASGAGQTVKLCNQIAAAINVQGMCEAMALGRAAGVDLDRLRTVMLASSGASWMLDKQGPAVIAGDASAGFRIDLMFKDLRLAQELAQGLAVPLPGSALVSTQYLEARAHGEGGNGNQALFRVYDRMSNQRRD